MSKSEIIKQILTNSECDSDKIYFITPASDEEIRLGHYIDIDGMKISGNPKKHAVITGIKMEKNDE